MSDQLLTVCPECGQNTYVKQVTAAGFQLKGSGWYVTDFRDNGAKPGANGSKAAASHGGSESGDSSSGSTKSSDAAAAPASTTSAPAAPPAPTGGSGRASATKTRQDVF